MTRSNLTIAENRVRDLETAFKTLFPEADADTVLAPIRSENSVGSANRNSTKAKNKSPIANLQDIHEANSPSESLPRDADGFDWIESAVTLSELSDGMAALSINPEGAGYLGEYGKTLTTIQMLNESRAGATSSVVPLRVLLERNISEDLGPSGGWQAQSLFSDQAFSSISENTL